MLNSDELYELTLDLFELLQGYRKSHNGRTEPFDCDCRFCKQVEEVLTKMRDVIDP